MTPKESEGVSSVHKEFYRKRPAILTAGKLEMMFGGELETIIDEINAAIAA